MKQAAQKKESDSKNKPTNQKEAEMKNKPNENSTAKEILQNAQEEIVPKVEVVKKEKIIKFFLPDSEILQPAEKFHSLKKNINFVKSFMKSKIETCEIDKDLLEKVKEGLKMKELTCFDSILDKKIKLNTKSNKVDEIIANKLKKNFTDLIEGSIKEQKIKDIRENKQKLVLKIKSLEESIKLIETNDLSKNEINISMNVISSRELIDENIKRDKIKEMKKSKQIMEEKIDYLDLQIHEILKVDEIAAKKFDIKAYLENFEKDKKEAELREFKWKKDQLQRAKKFEEDQLKIQEKMKEKEENEEYYYNQKKQEAYQAYLEKLRTKSSEIKEDINKLNEKVEEWKSKPIDSKQYLFKIAEENFKLKEIEEKEEKKNKMVEELAKKKMLFKPLEKGELDEYIKQHEENKKKKVYEKEKERLLIKEELMKKNASLPKSETKIYEKIVEEGKKIRENREKEKLDRVYNAMKIKQFSKVVLKNMVPKIDEEKKQELKDLISKSSHIRPERLGKSKLDRVLLKKPNPEKLKKSNWDLKLEPLDKNINRKRIKNIRNLSKTSINSEISKNNESNDISINRVASAKAAKRVPMIKNPDYLKLIRDQKEKKHKNEELETDIGDKEKTEKKWIKIFENDKNSFIDNVEKIKMKAMQIEEQAKRKEQIINLNGGSKKNPIEGQEISSMLIDSLKAKLAILENVSKK